MRKAWLATSFALVACATPPAPATDAAADAPGATCTSAADCDDGLFCNGMEQCMPGAVGASRLGCIAGAPVCLTGQACDEATNECTTVCGTNADADGDSHAAIRCGGDDCDDSDAHRFPGNSEVCDTTSHDEDCNLTTHGARDTDSDGHDDSGCCNVDGSGTHLCGDDCDDMHAAVHPGAPEICNGVDDDCNGVLDGPSEDSDHDGHANDLCAGVGGSDCNDRYPDVYDGAPEICDGIDSNCSSCDATTQLCTGAACATPTTRCGDPGSDTSEDADGDAHAPTTATCTGGFPTDDCDDTHAAAHPGGAEICDRLDDDCNGTIDDAPITDPLCAAPNASAACARGTGACVLRACAGGFTDCDGEAANGCETNLQTSADHCGQCGASCGAGGVCTNGVCDGIVDLDVSTLRACVLRSSGHVACWGDNYLDSLGDGTTVNRATPVEFRGAGSVRALSISVVGHCFAMTDGSVDCGDRGSLPAGPPITQIVRGAVSQCILYADHGVRCFGQNAEGELGDGTTTESATLVTPMGLPPVAQIALGRLLVCARLVDGRVMCWGNGVLVPTLVPGITTAVELSVGQENACVRLASGGVQCWGPNGSGQLGNGSTAGSVTPVSVTGLTDAVSMSLGGFMGCAVRAAGPTVCWGLNDYGGLGNGTLVGSTTPVRVIGLDDAVRVVVARNAGGATHANGACAIRASGAIACWGRGSSGQLGDGTFDDMRTTVGAEVFLRTAIPSVGGITTCARMSDGSARCWGVNNAGEIGDGTYDWSSLPRRVTGVSDATAVLVRGAFSTGDSHACTLHATGTVSCSGDNTYGELGDGTTVAAQTQVPVPGLSDARQLGIGGYFTCALRATGQIVCWGANDVGQLGDGTTTERHSPVAVSGITNAVELTTGEAHACARLADGGLRCWGANYRGQLGDGTTTASSTPVTVSGLVDVVTIAAGVANTCAGLADGGVACWGYNSHGLLGDGTTMEADVPTRVPGVSAVREISVGFTRTCVRRADGSVWCWGNGPSGGIDPPADFGGFTDVTRLSGNDDVCVLRATGQLLCAGSNFGGQLGDGTTYDRVSPVPVIGL
jgi:alpha-tubulin suppressor-like RCC1 family protein